MDTKITNHVYNYNTMTNPIAHIYDRLIKKAEHLMNNNESVAKLIDEAFEKIGKLSAYYYEIQDQVLALIRMLKAWLNREYTDVSTRSIVALIAALIYFVNPFDLIPDFIPIIGKIDDVLIISFLIKTLNKEIQRFMAWELDNKKFD